MESFNKIAPLVQSLFEDPINLAISDCQKFLVHLPHPKIPFIIEPGTLLQAEEPMAKAIFQDQKISSVVPKEVFGVPFKGVGVPIKNCKERQKDLADISTRLSEALGQISQAISLVTANVQEIADYSGQILHNIEQTNNAQIQR